MSYHSWQQVKQGVVFSILFLLCTLPFSNRTYASANQCSKLNIEAYLAKTPDRTTIIDKDGFYSRLRGLYPVYKQEGDHFAGTDAIIEYWNANPELIDPRWLAYILATSYHETAQRMIPVREHLAKTDAAAIKIFKKYDRYQRTDYWKKNGETGHHYFGRGYVQMTWDYNYKRADKWFEIDTTSRESYYWFPENALDPNRSVLVTYEGMVYGWFTGHCLLQHFPPNKKADWTNARRIINGKDRADDIALYATDFLKVLKASEIPSTVPQKQPPQDNTFISENKFKTAIVASSIQNTKEAPIPVFEPTKETQMRQQGLLDIPMVDVSKTEAALIRIKETASIATDFLRKGWEFIQPYTEKAWDIAWPKIKSFFNSIIMMIINIFSWIIEQGVLFAECLSDAPIDDGTSDYSENTEQHQS